MQRSRRGSVRVSHRQDRQPEVSSKNLTKRQLLKYIFTDFFRLSYDVAAIFFDALILPELYFQRPTDVMFTYMVANNAGGGTVYEIYMLAVIGILEISAAWVQILTYRRLWPKYYTLGEDERGSTADDLETAR